MRMLRIVLGGAAALLLVAGPALAGVGYSVQIDDPGTIARGTVPVRAHASGGIGDAEHAAYHVGSSWVDGAGVPMQKIGEGVFQAADRPWATTALPNGTYRLEVRIWGNVPPYDAADPNTFAKQVLAVSVDNPPPPPTGLRGQVGSASLRLQWSGVPTASRSDFLGYRVLRKRGPTCAGDGGYVVVAETSATAFTATRLTPGAYCFRVVALRSSEVSGVVASPASASVRLVVSGAAGGPAVPADPGFVTGSGKGAAPPPAPRLGKGKLEVSDGSYGDRLPYGPRRVTQGVDVEAQGAPAAREAGVDPRRTPTLVAAGLILAVMSLLVRRFLAGAPER